MGNSEHGFRAKLERHQPDLPIYLMVPADVVSSLGAAATFVVEVSVNAIAIGRRSIKPWGDGQRWFMELTKPQCGRLRVDEGDEVDVTVSDAPQTPPALEAALAENKLADRWARMNASDRRMISEHIFDAKKDATRAARVDRTIAKLQESS
ncbi:MAG: YdeI/OmpD-associated family protein [Pseudomonadota bacterium]